MCAACTSYPFINLFYLSFLFGVSPWYILGTVNTIKPKVFELGIKGPPSAVARVPGVYHPATDVSSQPSMQYDLRTGQYIRAPRSPEEVSFCYCYCCLVMGIGNALNLLVWETHKNFAHAFTVGGTRATSSN